MDFRHGGNRRVNRHPGSAKVSLPGFWGGRKWRQVAMSRQFTKEHSGERVLRDGIRATGRLGDKLCRRVESRPQLVAYHEMDPQKLLSKSL